ncbi:MAG: YgjP-like metallopeptidase domain-containing protein [Tannerellaceae bacterium]
MEKIIQDKELGAIMLRTSPRATRYSIKITDKQVEGIMPIGGDMNILIKFIEDNRKKILQTQQKRTERMPKGQTGTHLLLNEETKLQLYSMSLSITCYPQHKFKANFDGEILRITCPMNTDFAQQKVQDVLRDLLLQGLRIQSMHVLSQRLEMLAKAHSFTYTNVKIQSSHSRWGSCSASKSINLSCNLLLLPEHLIDYVLLHELCHTVELNHGDRFWALLDKVTSGRSLALKTEIKGYHPL